METEGPRPSPLELFLNFQRREMVIPLDDQHLGMEGFLSRKDRRSRTREEREQEVASIIADTHISPFFRTVISEEVAEACETGVTEFSGAEVVNKMLYGIDPVNGRLGIFSSDPQEALRVELHFWDQAGPYLAMREVSGSPSKVSLDDWADYLDHIENPE